MKMVLLMCLNLVVVAVMSIGYTVLDTCVDNISFVLIANNCFKDS